MKLLFFLPKIVLESKESQSAAFLRTVFRGSHVVEPFSHVFLQKNVK